MSKINNNEIKQLILSLGSSPSGLSNEEAQKNRIKYGANTIEKSKRQSFFQKFLMQFKNLMVLVLLISAIISLSTALFHKNYSDLFEGLLILGIVIVNALVGALQERKAENTLLLLEKQTQAKAKVWRNNQLCSLDIVDVVVGDIVELKSGDFVPADIRLIETNNFSCDESTLTGESKQSKKNANAKVSSKALLSDKSNMCFKGTNVSHGNARGIVISTGKLTEFGKIAGLIASSTKQKTPLEKNIDRIGKVITISVSIIVVVVFLVQIIFSQVNFGDAFMTAIALAVAAIPESLPAVITIIMALGVQRLAKHSAIVKTLSSVETLGCCDCICTDKTGTLTQNKMKVVSVFESCKTYKKNEFLQNTNHLERVFLISSLCSNANINSDGKIVGDSTECALWEFSLENNFNITKTRESFKRISEQPFSSETKKMVTINTLQNGTYAFIKGACDLLLDKCSFLRIDNKIVPMTSKLKSQILTAHSQFTNQAQRVLMLAEKPLCESEEFCEKDLVFVALVGMIDPPRPEVFDAINKCHKAGMKPVMITGDHKETAFAIAKSLNIAKTMNEIITGQELDAISDTELPKHVNKFSVFARVTPEHKSRIVKALKEQGHVVAMTGDGVNDAPSIKQADIGTCMGSGTDVTKSVSDLIITDDNFATIVVAVSEGRTIYNNIQKTIQFLISTNAVEVLGLFVASIIMRDSVFLTASQILFINLITDSLPAFALGIEPAEKNIMQKPPRNSKESIFSGEIGTAIIYQAFVQTLVVLVLFVWAYHTYGNATANTMTFITICLMQILHAINCKTNKSIFSINPFANKFFNISFVALLALILSVSLIPAFQTAFNIIAMSNVQWCIVTLASLSIVPLVEIFKLILKPQKI